MLPTSSACRTRWPSGVAGTPAVSGTSGAAPGWRGVITDQLIQGKLNTKSNKYTR